MLILSRKEGEQVVIGENVVITVVSVRGRGVRLSIEAPRDLPVHRMEVYRKIHAESEVEAEAEAEAVK